MGKYEKPPLEAASLHSGGLLFYKFAPKVFFYKSSQKVKQKTVEKNLAIEINKNLKGNLLKKACKLTAAVTMWLNRSRVINWCPAFHVSQLGDQITHSGQVGALNMCFTP